MDAKRRNLLSLILAFCVVCAAPAPAARASSGHAMLDAIVDGQVQRVAILLDQGVSPEVTRAGVENDAKTALMWAAETGQIDIIRLLLQYGAQVDRSNAKGGTALMYAAVNGHTEALRALIEAGADPDRRVRHGWTPLLLATVKGHDDSVRALAALGADVNTLDVYGWSLLMHAADRGDRTMVETLLVLGLDPHVTDAAGTSAGALARRGNHPDIVRILERAAARR